MSPLPFVPIKAETQMLCRSSSRTSSGDTQTLCAASRRRERHPICPRCVTVPCPSGTPLVAATCAVSNGISATCCTGREAQPVRSGRVHVASTQWRPPIAINPNHVGGKASHGNKKRGGGESMSPSRRRNAHGQFGRTMWIPVLRRSAASAVFVRSSSVAFRIWRSPNQMRTLPPALP